MELDVLIPFNLLFHEMPLFFIKDMNQSNTNLHCINQKPVPTQHQPNTNAHNASLFPYGFYSPRTFTFHKKNNPRSPGDGDRP